MAVGFSKPTEMVGKRLRRREERSFAALILPPFGRVRIMALHSELPGRRLRGRQLWTVIFGIGILFVRHRAGGNDAPAASELAGNVWAITHVSSSEIVTRSRHPRALKFLQVQILLSSRTIIQHRHGLEARRGE